MNSLFPEGFIGRFNSCDEKFKCGIEWRIVFVTDNIFRLVEYDGLYVQYRRAE